MRKRLLTLLPALTVAVLAGGVAWAQTTNLASLRVGTAGEGGVTFFNGSIVNESGPVVVADDLRVDGVITRLNGTADKPVRVDDDLEVTGDVTATNLYTKTEADARYVSDSSPSWDAQTSYTTVGASDMRPGNETYAYTYAFNGTVLANNNDGASYYASVQLPHGATVTGFQMFADDNNEGVDDYVDGYLYRTDIDDLPASNPDQMARANSDGTAVTFTDATIDNATVDNSAYAYHVRAEFGTGSDNDVLLKGFRIQYTTTAPY